MYIAMNSTNFDTRQMEVENLVPARRFNRGPRASMKGREAKSKDNFGEVKWLHKRREFSEMEGCH